MCFLYFKLLPGMVTHTHTRHRNYMPNDSNSENPRPHLGNRLCHTWPQPGSTMPGARCAVGPGDTLVVQTVGCNLPVEDRECLHLEIELIFILQQGVLGNES